MDGVSSVFKLVRLAMSSAISRRRACAISIGLELVGVGLVTVSPLLLKQLIDALVHPPDDDFSLWLAVALFVASWAGSGFVSALRSTQSTGITAAIGKYLTTGALLAALPTSVRERDMDSSRLLGQLERLPFSLTIIMDGLVWSSVPLILQLVVSLFVATTVLPVSEIVVLGLVLVAFAFVSFLAASQHQKAALGANAAASKASHIVGDVVRNGRRVVLNGNLKNEVDFVGSVLGAKCKGQVASAWSLARMSSLQFVTLTVGLLLLLGMAVRGVEQGQVTVGALVLLQAYAMRMVLPLGSFGFIFSHAGEALANVGEILKLQKRARVALSNPASPLAAPPLVQARSLCFRYGREGAGIDAIEAEFPPGSITAIVGANGSGKSTLAQVLAGIFVPQSGQVLIGGVDLQSIDPAERHRWVLYVPQTVSLFNRSLAENALYPPCRLSPEELLMRLTAWGFYGPGRLIDLSAPVGEHGEKLSGGQVQKRKRPAGPVWR
jgi:ABC-type multidrug transport system fused ATPase/permease subunit